jgi:hypothetical protein
MKPRSVLVSSSVLLASLATTQALAATSCEDLAKFSATHVTITVASTVESSAAMN